MPEMLDGLWTVEFGSSLGLFGAGVVVITGSRLLGGDPGYYYDGEFTLDNGNFTGILTVTQYNENIVSVFGDIKKFSFDFSGKLVGDEFEIRAVFAGLDFISRGKRRVALR